MWSNKLFYYWLIQFLGWGLYLGLVSISAYSQDKLDVNTIKIILILFGVSIVISNLIRTIFIRSGWLNLSPMKLFPKVLILAFLGGSIIYLSQFLTSAWFTHNLIKFLSRPLLEHFLSILGWFIILFIWIGFYLTYHFFDKSRIEEIKNLQLLASQNEIQLSQLRSQLNPHFIFNALNSIKALVTKEPESAKKAINELSTLLRSSLNAVNKKSNTLEEEMQIVVAYLKLEKIRFEDRLKYIIDLQDETKNVFVPPLMLQTLFENGVKHGIAKYSKGGEIVFKSQFIGDKLHLSIKNTGVLEMDESSDGVGVKNTQERLKIIYGADANFTIEQVNDWVEVKILIPTQKSKTNIGNH